MPVTYAGVGLTPPSSVALAGGIEFWHEHRIEEFDRDQGYRTRFLQHLPTPSVPNSDPPRIGVLHWPTGASRWATCHLVATGTQLALVRAALSGSNPATLSFSDGARTISAPMYMLPPRPILAKGTSDQNFYLITLVDQRWWWWDAAVSGGVTIGSAWTTFINSLFGAVGVTPTIDAVPGAYQPANFQVPTLIRWEIGFKPIPLIIDAACATIGMRVSRQLNGAVRVWGAANALTQDDASFTLFQNEIYTGGRMAVADVARTVPAQVSTVFWGFSPVEIGTALASLALAEYAGATGASGMVGQVVSDLPAVYDGAVRTNWATQAATDFYKWALARSEYTLRGFWNRTITPLDRAQEWVYAPDQLVTRVLRQPISDDNVYGDKPPTTRFPATLDSGWDADRGYDWHRDTLVVTPRPLPHGYVTAVPAKSGRDAFERSGREDLIAGTKILLYSNSDGDGWEFEFPTVYRDACVGGVLVRQKTTDNGVTWVTTESVGAPCGSGSGQTGSGGVPPGCLVCYPEETSGTDPYVVVDMACVDGVTYVIHARMGIVGNQTTGYPENTLYDFVYTIEGCCECASGSDGGSGGGASGSGTEGGFCDEYTADGVSMVRQGVTQVWRGAGGLILQADWDDFLQGYIWQLAGAGPGGGRCVWRTQLGVTWNGNGCVTLSSADGADCPDVLVCCGGGAGGTPTCATVDIDSLPATLNYTTSTSSVVGACAGGLSGTFTDALVSPREFTSGNFTPCGMGGPQQFGLRCEGGLYTLTTPTQFGGCPGAFMGTVAASGGAAAPLSLVFVAPLCWFMDATGNESDTVTITITD